MTFGERLRQLRDERRLSLDDVANAVGLTRPTIYRYETGAIRNVPPETVHKLASFFGVTRPYLMGWTEERGVDPHKNLDTVAEKLRNTEGEIVTENNTTYWQATGRKDADCTTAATQAVRALIKYGIARTPIYPQHIIQHSNYATVITFAHSNELDEIDLFTNTLSSRSVNDYFMTSSFIDQTGHNHYLFAVNRFADIGKLKLTLAVELGHIYLGHTAMIRNASRKQQEAECFAMHLVFPRAVIKLLAERNFVFTKESFSRIFGDCEWCLDTILTAHPVRVSPELNHLLKDQFVPYVDMLDKIGILNMPTRGAELDFSQYMEGYEE